MDKHIYTAAVVVRDRIPPRHLRTLILWGVDNDQVAFESFVRHYVAEHYPFELIQLTVAQAPDWLSVRNAPES